MAYCGKQTKRHKWEQSQLKAGTTEERQDSNLETCYVVHCLNIANNLNFEMLSVFCLSALLCRSMLVPLQEMKLFSSDYRKKDKLLKAK